MIRIFFGGANNQIANQQLRGEAAEPARDAWQYSPALRALCARFMPLFGALGKNWGGTPFQGAKNPVTIAITGFFLGGDTQI